MPSVSESRDGALRTVAGQSLAYLAGGVAGKALALITLPILARLLTPGQLGVLDVAAGLAAFVATVAIAGTDNSIPRFLPIEDEPSRIWGSALPIVAGIALAVALAGFVARDLLAQLLVHDVRAGGVMAAGLVYALAIAAFVSSLTVLRLRGAAKLYPMATTGTLILQMVGGVVLAFLLDDPLVAILLWWSLVSAIGAAVIFATQLPSPLLPDRRVMGRLVRFGLPFVPAAVAWTIGDLGIRSVLSQGDLAALGSYSIASRLVSIMALGISAFSLAWMPFIFRLDGGAETAAMFKNAALALVAVLGFVAVGLSALAPEAVGAVGGQNYASGVRAVAPLSAGMLTFGMFVLLSGASGVAFRTADVAWISVIGAAVQIGAAWLLVPAHALLAAGAASFLGYATALVLLRIRLGDAIQIASPALIVMVVVFAVSLSLTTLPIFLASPLAFRIVLPVALLLGSGIFGSRILGSLLRGWHVS